MKGNSSVFSKMICVPSVALEKPPASCSAHRRAGGNSITHKKLLVSPFLIDVNQWQYNESAPRLDRLRETAFREGKYSIFLKLLMD